MTDQTRVLYHGTPLRPVTQRLPENSKKTMEWGGGGGGGMIDVNVDEVFVKIKKKKLGRGGGGSGRGPVWGGERSVWCE